MSLLQRGCVKSVQMIDEFVKPVSRTTIQVNINQVNPAKSIVLFEGFKICILDSDNNSGYESSYTDAQLHSIESSCVKFTAYSAAGVDDRFLYRVVFQLVEFY